MDAHGESSREKAAGGYQRKGSPRKVSSGGKIVKKGRPGPGDHEKRVGRWGKAFSPHRSRLRKTKARQLRIRLALPLPRLHPLARSPYNASETPGGPEVMAAPII